LRFARYRLVALRALSVSVNWFFPSALLNRNTTTREAQKTDNRQRAKRN
jgi:hypothetical protein